MSEHFDWSNPENIERWIVRPTVERTVAAMSEKFDDSFRAHDQRLKNVEAGQFRENSDIISVKSDVAEIAKRVGALEAWKLKVALVYGVICAIVMALFAWVRDHLPGWLTKHH